MKAFSSEKENELPLEMVWAVSPAHSIPSGSVQRERRTGIFRRAQNLVHWTILTESINKKMILNFVNVANLGSQSGIH